MHACTMTLHQPRKIGCVSLAHSLPSVNRTELSHSTGLREGLDVTTFNAEHITTHSCKPTRFFQDLGITTHVMHSKMGVNMAWATVCSNIDVCGGGLLF